MMFSVVGALLLAVLLLLLAYLYNTYTFWKRRGVLYEPPLPLIGNFKGIGKTNNLNDIYTRLYKKFKGKAPFGGAYMFVSKSAVLVDLELIKHVLIKDFSNFHDRNTFHNVEDDPLTGNLIMINGEDWRAMRTKLTPAFTSARMKYMFPTVVKVGDQLLETMKDETNKTKDNIVDLKDICARFTTDVIGSSAFGVECNSLKDPNAEFRAKGRSVFAEPRHNAFVQMFIMTNPHLAKKLHMKMLKDSVTDFFINIVRQTVEYRLKNNVKRNDFMDLLIEMKAVNENLARDSLKNIDLKHGLTIEQMAAQTFVFFLAGFDTSSTTMSFCLYELAKNMEVQVKLRSEIFNTLKQSNNELTYEGMNSMTYLEQVIAETLRLYPVLPYLDRTAKNNYRVPNTSHVIEKDITVIIPVGAIHLDPEYYDKPKEFKPSRFEAAEIEKRHPMTYLPFGDGPRNCIGSRFGKMQTKVGLISLLKQYRFECCPLTEIPMEYDKKHFLIASENGICLKVTSL